MGSKLTTEIVIERINEVHNNRYILSNLLYVNKRTKVEVICVEHGSFFTKTEQLIRGQGCPECGLISQGNKRRLSESEFLTKCKGVHKNKYDYTKVDYQGMTNKVIITCKEHGDFEQTPSSHISGSGCPQCGFISQIKKRRLPIEDFISNSISTHGERYDYSKVDYTNNSTEVKIICSSHGIFNQRPDFHMIGSGCPNCNSSKGEQLIKKYLSDNNIEFFEQHTFEGLRMKRKLKCDFFLPKHNVVIEFNGIQHYELREHFGGEEGLNRTQNSDKLKRKFCIENQIKLLEIKYSDDVYDCLNLFLSK